MKRFLHPLIAFTLTACSASDSPPESRVEGMDSTMVVASEPGVPSDGRPVVVFLGTSLTAGLGLEEESETYVARLAQLADSAGYPINAVNAGVSGETSAGGLRRLDWVLRQHVDVLVVELGANDGLRGLDPLAMAANLNEIIERARTRYPDVAVLLAGMEAPPNLGAVYTGAFREIFRGIAESQDVVLIPFLLDGVAGVPELNQEDRIHPTAEGHEMIARTTWPYLEGVLEALEGVTP